MIDRTDKELSSNRRSASDLGRVLKKQFQHPENLRFLRGLNEFAIDKTTPDEFDHLLQALSDVEARHKS